MVDLLRIISVYTGQAIVVIIHLILLYKIIKRKKRTNSSIALGIYFILISGGFSLNFIYVFITIDPLAFILYIISAFLVIFSSLYIMLSLLYLYKEISRTIFLILNIIFGIVIVLLLSIPNGVRFDVSTNWTPKYSWEFLISVYIFFTIGGVLPSFYFFIKILRQLPQTELKKRVKIFFSGELLYFTSVYGLALYNTWDNPIFRTLWLTLGYFLILIVAIVVYFGLARELKE